MTHCFGKGLSTQMESLQRLGVTKPGHITDLLVTDLEEAGLHKKSLTSFGWPCGDELSSKS